MISQMAFDPYATFTWAPVIHLPLPGSQTNAVYCRSEARYASCPQLRLSFQQAGEYPDSCVA